MFSLSYMPFFLFMFEGGPPPFRFLYPSVRRSYCISPPKLLDPSGYYYHTHLSFGEVTRSLESCISNIDSGIAFVFVCIYLASSIMIYIGRFIGDVVFLFVTGTPSAKNVPTAFQSNNHKCLISLLAKSPNAV